MPTRAVVELGVVRCITAVGDPNTDTPPSCAQYLVDVERGDADMMAAIGVPTCTMALDAGISVLGWSWVPIGPVADNLDEGSNRACAGGAITIQVSLGGEETLDGDADVIESGEGFSG
jgi:hypothetical protein